MKQFGQTKDGVIDNLLRTYVSRPSNPHQVCPEFDADRANAYIERALTGASRLHYEEHLSACAACRKNVVALVRLAEADAVTTWSPAREAARSTWLSGVKQAFRTMSQPQWAMAAAAVIVLAISLPVLLSRNQVQDASLAPAVATEKPQSTTAAVSPSNNPSSAEAAPPLLASAKQREQSDEKGEVARNAPAPSAAPELAAGTAAGVELSKKAETSAAQTVDEAQRKSADQFSQSPAPAGAAPVTQVARNDSDQTRQQPSEKDSAQRANEPKAARAEEERAKEKTDKTEEVAAPPAASSEVGRSRGGLRRSGRLALRDSNTAEAVRPEERKFNGKKFLFRDGAWTDKDFDPNKDLPIVTIIRDSNVYLEVLNKRPGLKPFLTGFAAADRAIIVYKGTVYKLIPQ